MSVRALVIILATDLDRANQTAQLYFDYSGGLFTFTEPLSSDGLLPATHYWCSAQFTDENYILLGQVAQAFTGSTIVPYDLDTEPNKPDQVLIDMNLQRISPK